jgi:hypothetical protein
MLLAIQRAGRMKIKTPKLCVGIDQPANCLTLANSRSSSGRLDLHPTLWRKVTLPKSDTRYLLQYLFLNRCGESFRKRSGPTEQPRLPAKCAKRGENKSGNRTTISRAERVLLVPNFPYFAQFRAFRGQRFAPFWDLLARLFATFASFNANLAAFPIFTGRTGMFAFVLESAMRSTVRSRDHSVSDF